MQTEFQTIKNMIKKKKTLNCEHFQVKIDGFDPDKFRAANKRNPDESSILITQHVPVARYNITHDLGNRWQSANYNRHITHYLCHMPYEKHITYDTSPSCLKSCDTWNKTYKIDTWHTKHDAWHMYWHTTYAQLMINLPWRTWHAIREQFDMSLQPSWTNSQCPRPHYTTMMSMPGSVPSYDPLEQQLLASLERELGVL